MFTTHVLLSLPVTVRRTKKKPKKNTPIEFVEDGHVHKRERPSSAKRVSTIQNDYANVLRFPRFKRHAVRAGCIRSRVMFTTCRGELIPFIPQECLFDKRRRRVAWSTGNSLSFVGRSDVRRRAHTHKRRAAGKRDEQSIVS